MADVTISVRTDIEDELADAFLALYANPDSLTGEELCKLHCKNFLASVLNRYREQQAVDAAKAGVTVESDVE